MTDVTPVDQTSAGHVAAIEVKLSATVDDDDVRHLNWLEDAIGDRLLDKIVLSTGPQAYRRPERRSRRPARAPRAIAAPFIGCWVGTSALLLFGCAGFEIDLHGGNLEPDTDCAQGP